MTGRRSGSSRAGATLRQGPLFLLCLREQCIETVVDLLRRLGCPTEACHTLTDAQALFSDDRRNVVVIDMTAELAEAAACVAALREDHARSPIVVIECSNRPIVAAALLRSGADDVIGADCALIEVIARLKRFCISPRPPTAATPNLGPRVCQVAKLYQLLRLTRDEC